MIFPSAHFKPANRSPEYFSMASPSSSHDMHKDLRLVLSLLFGVGKYTFLSTEPLPEFEGLFALMETTHGCIYKRKVDDNKNFEMNFLVKYVLKIVFR